MVTEHVEGDDLSAFIHKHGGKLDEQTARLLFHQLITGVDYVHSRQRAHRNLQLSTILVLESGNAEPKLKISAFDLMTSFNSPPSATTSLTGSALFTPPEVFMNSVASASIDSNQGGVDVWSCGVVLFLMLYGQHPFLPPDSDPSDPSSSVTLMIENAVKGLIQFPTQTNRSDLFVDLLQRILVPAPHKRYTIKQILSHPWLVDLQQPPSPILQLQSPELICRIVNEAARVMGDPQSTHSTHYSDVAPSSSLGNSADAGKRSNASGRRIPKKKNGISSKRGASDLRADDQELPAGPSWNMGPESQQLLGMNGSGLIQPSSLSLPLMQTTGSLPYIQTLQLGWQQQMQQPFVIPILQTTTTGISQAHGPYLTLNPQMSFLNPMILPQQLMMEEEIRILQNQLRIRQLIASVAQLERESHLMLQNPALFQPSPALDVTQLQILQISNMENHSTINQ